MLCSMSLIGSIGSLGEALFCMVVTSVFFVVPRPGQNRGVMIHFFLAGTGKPRGKVLDFVFVSAGEFFFKFLDFNVCQKHINELAIFLLLQRLANRWGTVGQRFYKRFYRTRIRNSISIRVSYGDRVQGKGWT